MKILKKYIDRKKKKGYVTFVPEEDEDLWFLFNILKADDTVRMKINRKIQVESATGFVKTSKRYILCRLRVLEVDFDYDKNGTGLFMKTKNIGKNNYIDLGALQTATVDLFYPITVYKNYWDKISLEFLDQSRKFTKTSDIAALLIENGTANTFYIKNNFSIHQGKIEKSLPRKKTSLMAYYNKALDKFYGNCLELIINIFDLNGIKCFIIGGPGTTPDTFMKFIKRKSEMKQYDVLRKNLSKFLVVRASSSQSNALNEVLEDPAVQKLISHTRALKETVMLQTFFKMIRNFPSKAVYGEKEVNYAQDQSAIEHLLITDSLFRSRDFRSRKKYIQLVDKVRRTGGTVHIFSDLHPSGQKLKDITGVAGILRFPIDLDALDELNESDTDAITEYSDETEKSKTESQRSNSVDLDDPAFDAYFGDIEPENKK